jgi:hypothetical protein
MWIFGLTFFLFFRFLFGDVDFVDGDEFDLLVLAFHNDFRGIGDLILFGVFVIE